VQWLYFVEAKGRKRYFTNQNGTCGQWPPLSKRYNTIPHAASVHHVR